MVGWGGVPPAQNESALSKSYLRVSIMPLPTLANGEPMCFPPRRRGGDVRKTIEELQMMVTCIASYIHGATVTAGVLKYNYHGHQYSYRFVTPKSRVNVLTEANQRAAEGNSIIAALNFHLGQLRELISGH